MACFIRTEEFLFSIQVTSLNSLVIFFFSFRLPFLLFLKALYRTYCEYTSKRAVHGLGSNGRVKDTIPHSSVGEEPVYKSGTY